uniref:Uncharacterized protein n=1 Tax=Cacopsylla melanoneura TaxID=428564 RepID=A0A8D8Y9Q0_9HEMI
MMLLLLLLLSFPSNTPANPGEKKIPLTNHLQENNCQTSVTSFFAENEEAAQILYQVLVRRPTNNEMKPPQLIDDRWVIACTEHQLSRRNCDVSSINNFFSFYYWTESEPDAGGLCAFIRAKDKGNDHALVLLKENKYILRCTKWGFDFFVDRVRNSRHESRKFHHSQRFWGFNSPTIYERPTAAVYDNTRLEDLMLGQYNRFNQIL